MFELLNPQPKEDVTKWSRTSSGLLSPDGSDFCPFPGGNTSLIVVRRNGLYFWTEPSVLQDSLDKEIGFVAAFFGVTVSYLNVYEADQTITGDCKVNGQVVWLPKISQDDNMRAIIARCFLEVIE